MPGSYYPTKQELEEDVSIGGTPEEPVAAVLRSVRIRRLARKLSTLRRSGGKKILNLRLKPPCTLPIIRGGHQNFIGKWPKC